MMTSWNSFVVQQYWMLESPWENWDWEKPLGSAEQRSMAAPLLECGYISMQGWKQDCEDLKETKDHKSWPFLRTLWQRKERIYGI